jgi:DNA mismatch repair protein MutS
MAEAELTPMMRQYQALKDEHPQAILLFRLGDFFEAFFDDAHVVARELQLTLTSRPVAKGRRIPMCGIPHHALPVYLRRLIDRGHRVAICDQVEDPRQARTLVRREVVRVVTPGTVIEDDLLSARENNFIAAAVSDGDAWGIALADVSTGEFLACCGAAPQRIDEALGRWRPREIIAPDAAGAARDGGVRGSANPDDLYAALDGAAAVVTRYDAQRFAPATAARELRAHLGVATLAAFGLDDRPAASARDRTAVIAAAGALLQYLQATHRGSLVHLRGLRLVPLQEGLLLDDATRRALGLWTAGRHEEPTGDTLLSVLDVTETGMGARLLRRWLAQPLAAVSSIEERQDAVEALAAAGAVREHIRAALRRLGDLERLLARLSHDAGGPRDLAGLRDTLEALPALVPAASSLTAPALRRLVPPLSPPPALAEELRRALADPPPLSPREGGVIRHGFDPDVDALREGAKTSKDWMAQREAAERQRTGVRGLRIGFNQVMGYYIEVAKSHMHLVPSDYVRKGTLAGAERYITAEMKEHEARILSAQERINAREYDVFCALRDSVRAGIEPLQACARALAELDVYAALAEAAVRYAYVRPKVTEDREIRITAGRHPVVERALGAERFVPNDATLGSAGREILILTGPNFGGKSTYIRQTALLVVLAQLGSFVPARDAHIGLVDRIFTRVGATDDLAAGRSTFLSEMIEVARVLTQATDRSLVILDEVGRGTSTYDGMSLAWAVVEDLHDRVRARTLFATHYHELTELAAQLDRVTNVQVLVREDGHDIVFLHRVAEGAATSSYGIHVARLAGVPDAVIRRAREVLGGLERAAARSGAANRPDARRRRRGPSRGQQLVLPLPHGRR